MCKCATEEIKGELDILFFTGRSSEEERKVYLKLIWEKVLIFFPANTICKEAKFLIIGLSFLLTVYMVGW